MPESALTTRSSLASRPAFEMCMPLRMLGAEMPRDTMLMTSVSDNTAQMLDGRSGSSAAIAWAS